MVESQGRSSGVEGWGPAGRLDVRVGGLGEKERNPDLRVTQV